MLALAEMVSQKPMLVVMVSQTLTWVALKVVRTRKWAEVSQRIQKVAQIQRSVELVDRMQT